MHAAQTLTAERRPGPRPSHAILGEPAIDLVHLARQTGGDPALEAELLAMFDRQSAQLLARLSAPGAGGARKPDLAHTLRGSALAIGAGRVAGAALALETMLESAIFSERAGREALAVLAGAVAEARAEIGRLLG
jgi:HPt (histidine-containing phosphotransfer) domain-containing protein